MYKKKKGMLLWQGAAVLFSYVCIWLLTMGTLAMFLDVFADKSVIAVAKKDVSLAEDVFGNWKGIQTGLRFLANNVLKKWSEYYGVWIPALAVGNYGPAEIVSALTFLALVFFLWETFCVLGFQRKLPAILPGLLIFVLDLLVGYVPEDTSMIVYAAGCFGILPLCRKKHGRTGKRRRGQIEIYQGVCGACLMAVLLLGLGVTKLVAGEHTSLARELHPDVKNWQRNLETKITVPDFGGLWQLESGAVTNRTPAYEGKVVMELSVTEMPTGTVYLRGYVGDTYRTGTWVNTVKDDFAKETAKWPKDIRTGAGMDVLNMAYRTGKYLAAATVSYRISYLDIDNHYAYLPYFVDLDSVNSKDDKSSNGNTASGVSVEAEAMVLRHGEASLTVEGVGAFPVERVMDMELSTSEKLLELWNGSDMPELSEMVGLSEQATLSEWYTPYTEKYYTVPRNLRQIKELGGKLTTELKTLYERAGKAENSIAWRISGAELVKRELSGRAQYTLALPRLPFGKDVVEYFLFDSGRGFCQHYAAAGVLLLREMGIPARYVTGYAVFRDAFRWEKTGAYVADVKDEDAHAWVEIYLDGLGWFPVEMTEAQSDPPEQNVVSEFSEIQQDWEKYVQNLKEEEQETTQNAEDTQDDEAKEAMENGEEILAGLLLAVGPGVLAVWWVRHLAFRAEQRLYTQKNYRKTVRRISERIYRILRRKGVLGTGSMDDKAFRETLQTKLKELPEEERNAYFNVLERAAFDCEEIGKEDMQICMHVYKKVKKLTAIKRPNSN